MLVQQNEPEAGTSDLNLPLAIRRIRRTNRGVPAKFRDDMPQAQPSGTCQQMFYSWLISYSLTVDPVAIPYIPAILALSLSSSILELDSCTASTSRRSEFLRSFRTSRNIFGLSRNYYGWERPSHDPEDCTSPHDLYDACTSTSASDDSSTELPSTGSFYPYPNQASFLLGDWYWNHSIQKSQEGFKKLTEIVGDPLFKPGDIRSTNWTKINKILSHNEEDACLTDREWLGEDNGWKRTTISINVPFHYRMSKPGSQTYLAGELYHRSIVSVIRERVTNNDKHFHYEPYELLWKCSEDEEEVRVHGELYTSASFLSEHEALLNSPAEPGCDAPRAIVALMFWSDATHLTSFGNAKLWPCYMYFGNDSKYQRAKPSSQLCNHIAYFQTVSCCNYDY